MTRSAHPAAVKVSDGGEKKSHCPIDPSERAEANEKSGRASASFR